MKKLLIVLTTAALPFLLVWAAFILTGFSFNPTEVFQNGSFWAPSFLFWFVWILVFPAIIDSVYEK